MNEVSSCFQEELAKDAEEGAAGGEAGEPAAKELEGDEAGKHPDIVKKNGSNGVSPVKVCISMFINPCFGKERPSIVINPCLSKVITTLLKRLKWKKVFKQKNNNPSSWLRRRN